MCHRVYRVSSLCHSRIPVLYKCRLFQKECAFHEIRTALAKRSMKEKNTSYNNDGRHFEKAFSRSNIHWPLVTKKNGFCCSICRFAQLLRPQIVSLAFPRLFFQCAKHTISLIINGLTSQVPWIESRWLPLCFPKVQSVQSGWRVIPGCIPRRSKKPGPAP